MFNLLPENLKDKIRKEYLLRRWVVIFIFLVFIGGSFFAFLFPTWIISFYKEKEMSQQAEISSRSSITADVKEVTANIKKLNLELKTIDTALEYQKVIPFIKTILSKKTRLIYVNEITYSSNGPLKVNIFLEGVSATRGGLLDFVKSLEETKMFTSVNLPISNFAKEKNINFSMNLIIEPKDEKK